MKPVKLEFCGINSFSEKTKIDFGPLTKSGLFGIFGDTGSGKSSILDAINFALFGDIERCGGKGVDYINTKCSECSADFTFDVNSGGTYTEYEIIRRKTRDKQEKNKQGDHKVTLYRKGADGKDYVLANSPSAADKAVIEILGVGEDDFRMCIALPQGEFAQFLNANPAERAKLIQRLFDLSRYGEPLSKKISNRVNEAKVAYTLYSTQLEGFADITKKALEDAKKQSEEATEAREGIKEQQDANAAQISALTVLDNRHRDLVKAQNRLDTLSKNRDEMESLRRDLSALPACREAASLRQKANTCKRDIAALSDTLMDLSGKLQKAGDDLGSYREQLEAGDLDHRINEYTALLASYATCAGVPEKLKAHMGNLATLQGKLADAENSIAIAKNQLLKDMRRAAADEAALEAYKGDDISSLIPEDFKDAILKAGYEDFNAFLASLSSKIQPYEAAESELYALVQGEISAESSVLADKISAVTEGTTALSGLVQNIQGVMHEKSRLQANASKSAETAQRTQSALELAAAEAAHLGNEIATEAQQTEEFRMQLKAVYGDAADYNACKRKAEAGKSSAESEKKRLTKAIQDSTDLQSSLSAQVQGKKASLTEKQAQLEGFEADILDAVSRAGKQDEQECLDIVEKYRGIPHAEDTLTAYDNEVFALSAQIANLLAEPGLKEYDTSQLEAAKAEKKALDAQYEQYTKDITHADEQARDIEKKLGIKAGLEKDYRKAVHDKDLIDQLSGLIGKSQFLNFVAEEYLADISYDASEMLAKLSKGQFYLRYEGKQFIILDNFDGGVRRNVNTLSGGETFLVSLSLALSLSRITSGRSEKMIEFFFLDEGFGSLDTKLCNEVVDALETVRATYPEFTIGVISHVEDLMRRIENKITVEKATDEHGSIIHASY